MLISIAVILLSGLLLGALCQKIRFPSLFGMIVAGIIIGPYALNLIDSSIMSVSAEIRRIALIIILIRAGLKLDMSDLKKVGRPAVLMCFVPACFEMIGMTMLASVCFGINRLDAAILGAVVGAVSPAVIVPRMIRLIDEGYGTKQGIPQMILAGASVDDVFVIVMFSAFIEVAQGKDLSPASLFLDIPSSLILGIMMGFMTGFVLFKWYSKIKMNPLLMTMVLLAVSFILSAVETEQSIIPFASLIAIMCVGMVVKKADSSMARILSEQYDKLWIVAEIFLFVLVGASVAVDHARDAGLKAVILIVLVLSFRMLGVFICVLGTKLNLKEKIFCMIAYTPKATVQAAIGGVPLAIGLPSGDVILTVAVVSILLTAPLGAFGIDLTYRKCLQKDDMPKVLNPKEK